MGLYHTVHLVYGARITNNEMNPHLWESVEKLSMTSEFHGLELFTLGDGESEWLVIDSSEVETNDYQGLNRLPESQQDREAHVRKAADQLDIEIDYPGWFVLHDYS